MKAPVTTQKLKILIVGGYGSFGGRLVRLLAAEPGLDIVVAGRTLARAERLVAQVTGAATVTAAELDRDGDLETPLAKIAPDIVIDASGPFQTYADDPYRVVEAAFAAGSSYLDLADDRGFVLGLTRLDQKARDAGLFALSGASTCPALTGAIYRRLTRDFADVDSVTGGIAPSPHSGVGPSVIRAIAAYAGRAIRVRRGGQTVTAYPFTETRRYTVAPEGYVPLRSLTYSLVDVPDLELLAELDPRPASVWLGAAPVPAVYHGAFRLLARAVRRGLLSTLEPSTGLMHFVMHRFSWGEHRGGLFLDCQGRDRSGNAIGRSWHLVAEADIGPMTPTLACVALVRAALAGKTPMPGARPAHAELELEDFERLFRELGAAVSERQGPAPIGWPLFRRILGDAWSSLPDAIASAHDFDDRLTLTGRAAVIRGRSPIARAVAAIFRFPHSADDVPVTVEMLASRGEEKWRRDFAGRCFSSTLSAGDGKWSTLLCERFGPFRFGMALVVDDARLRYVMRRWSFAGLPMPFPLRPQGVTFEAAWDGRFCFDVEIALPLIGHIVTYRGWLEPEDRAAGNGD